MKIQLLKMKADLKVLAKKIRTLKSTRKQCTNGYVSGLESTQFDFRAKHIAYCMLRGRTLEQIEPKLREPNSWTNARVRKAAAAIVSEVLNPKPPVEQPIEQVKETLWNKVTSFIS